MNSVNSKFYGKEFFGKFIPIEKKRDPTTLQFFKHERKGFSKYSIHGKDGTKKVSKVFPELKNEVTREKYEKYTISSILLSKSFFERIVAKIFEPTFLTDIKTIEVLTKEGRYGNWNVTESGSRGNLKSFQDIVFKSAQSSGIGEPSLMCVGFQSKTTKFPLGLSVGIVKSSKNEIFFSNFLDNNQFSNLESIVIQLNVTECLFKPIKGNDYLNTKIFDVLKRTGGNITVIEEKPIKNVGEQLKFLLKKSSYSSINFNDSNFSSCLIPLGYCFNHLDLLADTNNKEFFKIQEFNHQEFMKLDASVVRALDILPFATMNAKNSSLFHILNNCKTKMGARRLNNWLRQPLVNKEKIKRRHEIVDSFFQDSLFLGQVQDSLKRCPDLDFLLKELQTGKAKLLGLVKLYQFILTFEELSDAFSDHIAENNNSKHIEELAQMFNGISSKFSKFARFIETVLDIDRVVQENEYLIVPTQSEQLMSLYTDLKKTKKKIDKVFKKVLNNYDLDEKLAKLSKIKGMEQDGLCIMLSGKNRKNISKTKKIKELKMTKNTYYITTDKLQNYALEHQKMIEAYKKEQSVIEKEVLKICLTYIPLIEVLREFVCEVDILSTFAKVSISKNFIKPEIQDSETNQILISKGRHPIVENTFCISDNSENISGKQFIPNDTVMTKENGTFHLIGGANMAGKSTYIKQVAIIVLMAQVGCFVPAEKALISIRDGIFARIGANDYLFRGVSTFMCEMLESASILQNATSKSLIIIDELGRGTSTFDGYGLAWAISEYIITKIQCFCLFATHFHELSRIQKRFKESVKVFHLSIMKKDTKSGESGLSMLYKLEEGTTGKSYGIEVAKMVKFPKTVINRAKRKVKELSYEIGEDEEESQPKKKKRKITKETENNNALMKNSIEEFKKLNFSQNDEENKRLFSEFQKRLNSISFDE